MFPDQDHTLILASKSTARQSMLKNAGLLFKTIPSDVDEEAIKTDFLKTSRDFAKLTLKLAESKAIDVSQKNPNHFVIGSDQTLEWNGELLSKATNKDDARKKLIALKGKTHTLTSAVCVAKNQEILFSATDQAHLKMRDFRDDFLDHYMEKSGEVLTTCVGAYAIEGTGAWLFEEIKGDYFTILGMPLLPLLTFLQSKGFHP